MTKVCPYCLTQTDMMYGHLYACPELNKRIKTVGKRGRLARPLNALTHIDNPNLCNCQACNKETS